GVIEDDYPYFQNLAKAIFAVVPLQAKKIESMAQIHSFYIFNLKNELYYYRKELFEDEDVLESAQSNNDRLEISLIVDFSYANFGEQDNAVELFHTTQRSNNIKFNSVAIVEREF
ncbi:11579_t:CDS:2, partial [Cetraspora pellucida]